MKNERIRKEGALIIQDGSNAPSLICGVCGSNELTGTTAAVKNYLVILQVACSQCGMIYQFFGNLRE